MSLLLHQPYFAKGRLSSSRAMPPPKSSTSAMRASPTRTTGASWWTGARLWPKPITTRKNGPTSYIANGPHHQRPTSSCAASSTSKADRLNAYFDTTVAIQDAMLLASLSQERTSRMKDITATIQKESKTRLSAIRIATCCSSTASPGSGKTSVLMQRIAYLFYRQRETLRPRRGVSDHPESKYSAATSRRCFPTWENATPETMTFNQFMAHIMPPERSRGRSDVDLSALERIDEAVRGLRFERTISKTSSAKEPS